MLTGKEYREALLRGFSSGRWNAQTKQAIEMTNKNSRPEAATSKATKQKYFISIYQNQAILSNERGQHENI